MEKNEKALKYFVNRLEKMIEKYPEDRCDYCPGAAHFSADKTPDCNCRRYNLEVWCYICQEFMDVKDMEVDKLVCCPCDYYSSIGQNAIEVAMEKIREFRGKE